MEKGTINFPSSNKMPILVEFGNAIFCIATQKWGVANRSLETSEIWDHASLKDKLNILRLFSMHRKIFLPSLA
jgi:hypothetical protein